MPPVAITRAIPSTFAQALVRHPSGTIDVEAARAEHAGYRRALEQLGFSVIELPADDRHPDCCFVEDVAVVLEGVALLTRPGAPSRRGEVEPVAEALSVHARIERMQAPATLEGGDCLRLGDRLFIGEGERSNAAGIERAREVFGAVGIEVVAVPLGSLLHLKCVCSSPGRGRLLLADGTLPAEAFGVADPLRVPAAEAHAANCVAQGDRVLIPEGCPETATLLGAEGFVVLTLDNEQIRRADGALTCLSLRLG